MKICIKTPVIFLALFFLIPFNMVKAEEAQQEYKVGSSFSVPKLGLSENTFIIDYKYDDVTGDNIRDNIILVGEKDENVSADSWDNIKLIIRDGKNKKYHKLSSGKFTSGGRGRIFLGDFNGDKTLDMLMNFCGKDSGSDSWYSLIAFSNCKTKYLLEHENSSFGLSFSIDFVDDYKISIFNKELNKFFSINAESKKDTYTSLGIYDNKGEIIKRQEGLYTGITELRPADIDKDGVYELVGIQRLSGICEADIVGYAKSLWRYEKESMKLLYLDLVPYARPGNLNKMETIVPVNSSIY